MLRLVTNFSGGGRTILNFLDEIAAGRLDAQVVRAITNRMCDGVDRLRARGIEVVIVAWTKDTTPESYAAQFWPVVEDAQPDLVLNCGFLRLLLVPPAWEGRIFNIHPSLLPQYGGKGMYGNHVHRAVLANGDSESGCTVHFVTSEYDTGPIVLQERVPVRSDDTVESLAARVFAQECVAYPEAVRLYQQGRLSIEDGKVTIR